MSAFGKTGIHHERDHTVLSIDWAIDLKFDDSKALHQCLALKHWGALLPMAQDSTKIAKRLYAIRENSLAVSRVGEKK